MKPSDWSIIGVVAVAILGGVAYVSELKGRVDGLDVDVIKEAEKKAVSRINSMTGRPELINKDFSWNQGVGERKMIRTDEGFCYLTHIQGKFEGHEEAVWINVRGDYWYLSGKSRQRDVAAKARCWKWPG